MTCQRKKFSRHQKLEVVRQIEHGEKTLSEVGRCRSWHYVSPANGARQPAAAQYACAPESPEL